MNQINALLKYIYLHTNRMRQRPFANDVMQIYIRFSFDSRNRIIVLCAYTAPHLSVWWIAPPKVI
jgi:hypothetical protein